MSKVKPLRVILYDGIDAGPIPIEEGRAAQKQAVAKAIDSALQYHAQAVPLEGEIDMRWRPPHAGFKTPTGIGKSEEFRRGAVSFVIAQKRRSHHLSRIAFLVPTHRLAEEARSKMAAMEAQGVCAAIWQSRQAKDLETGEPLCRNLEAVKAAYAIGADVQRSACICGRGRNKIKCPFYDSCAFQAQDAAAKGADVVFAALDLGWHGLGAIGDGFGLCIIDEGFWQKGLITKPNESRMRLYTLDVDKDWKDYPVNSEQDGTKTLRSIVQTFLSIFTPDRADGPLTKQELIAAKLMMEGDNHRTSLEFHIFAKAAKLEWGRKVKSEIKPNTSAKDRVAIVESCKFLGSIKRRSALWHCCDDFVNDEELISGRLSLITVDGVRFLQVLRKKQIHDDILALPIIHGDATMLVELVQYFLPELNLGLDLQVTSPHATTTQIQGLAVGKSILSDKGKHAATQPARLERLRTLVEHLAKGRRTLVICQIDVEPAFADIPNVETNHFGAIEGLDQYGDVPVLITIGRPMPSPHDVELMMSALTGKAVAIGGMIEQKRPAKLKVGGAVLVKVRAYADPLADQALNAIAVAAVIQALGRARGVNRTAANPIEMYAILHDLVLPIEIDAVVGVKDVEPNEIDKMIGRGLLAERPGDAMKFHPDLFSNLRAAQHVYRRAPIATIFSNAYSAFGTCSIANAYSPFGTCSDRAGTTDAIKEYSYSAFGICSTICHFKPSGAGQKFRRALVSAALAPTARKLIEAALGPLAVFEIITDHHQSESARPSRGGRGLPLVWGKPGSNLAARLAAQGACPPSRPRHEAQQLSWRGPATPRVMMASGP